MTLLILHPLRWHLGLSAFMALACSCFSGACLSTLSKASSLLSLPHRTLPLYDQDMNTRLREQMARSQEDKQQTQALLMIRDRELKQVQSSITIAKEKAASLDTDDSLEKQAVLKLHKQRPEWGALQLSEPEVRALADVWEFKSNQVERALEILQASGKAWKDKGVSERQKRQSVLAGLKIRFDRESAEALAVLDVRDLRPEIIASLLSAVREIIELLGPSRAVVGMTFTNSAGIEMAWVPNGGFWIGRNEVTSAAYNSVKGLHGGDDKPMEGISFLDAVAFLEDLNKREADFKAALPPGQSLRPATAEYDLPSVKQWRLVHKQEKNLGMKGFSDDLSEWSQDRQSSGLATKTVFLLEPSPSWIIALKGDSAIALPPEVNGTYNLYGPDKKTTGKGGKAEIWVGRLGLRVILVPKPE